jgi:molybdenum cofactor biosynthesis protein B
MSESTIRHKAEAPTKLTFAVFTCSTSRYQQKGYAQVKDLSGDLIESMLKKAGHEVSIRKIISDDKTMIEENARTVLDSTNVDVAIFCGGTGITPTDVTIEAITPFLEKTLLGFGELFRRFSFDQIGSAAILSRAIAGIAKGKVLFCIPGSPEAVKLCLERLILPEAGHLVKHARE